MNNIIDSIVGVIKKHSPEILVAIGVGGIITGTVLACKETKEVDPILEDHNNEINYINQVAEAGSIEDKETHAIVEYTEKDRRRDITITYLRTTGKLIKLYWPSVLTIGGSIGCILGSHKIMTNRNVGLTAAYAGLSETFNNYRQNIIKKYGEAADIEARHNLEVKKVKGKDDEPDTYKYTKTDKTAESDLSRFFDAESNFWDTNVNINLSQLIQTRTNLNRRLKTRRSHKISMNEIYDALDLRPAPQGEVIGYEYIPGTDALDENGIPQVIKFTIFVLNNRGEKTKKSLDDAIACGDVHEPVMLLDFPGVKVIA